MKIPRNVTRLAETRKRLETLVSIRFLSGFSQDQQAEYHALTEMEQTLLGVHA